MDNIKIGLGLQSHKINILVIKDMTKIAYDEILKIIDFKHILTCSNREEFLQVLKSIQIAHINEGVLILTQTNFKISDIDIILSDFINKVKVRQQKGTSTYGNSFYIDGEKFKIQTLDEILDELKLNFRKLKVAKLKTYHDKTIIIDYVIKLNKNNNIFKLIIDENKLNMSWDDFEKYDIIERKSIINNIYTKELFTRIDETILNFSDPSELLKE